MNEEYLGIVEMMAATLAHEVKNPLSLIRANIDYIELCDKEKKYINNYKIMRNELDRANEILYDFIAFMMPGAQKSEDVNICSIIDEVVSSYETTLNKPIKFVRQYPKNIPLIIGDRQRLRVVAANVIKNAVEAQSTLINIKVSVKNNMLKLTVQDNGCGISQETLDKIKTDIFYTTKKYGSGLGVNICKKITKEHGGIYNIKPKSKGGCEVVIELPLKNT